MSEGGFERQVWYMILAGGGSSDALEPEHFDWDKASPVVKETLDGGEALIVFQTRDMAADYIKALVAEGIVRPGGVQSIYRRTALRKIQKQFGIHNVAVNPPVEGVATEVISVGEFAKRLKRR